MAEVTATAPATPAVVAPVETKVAATAAPVSATAATESAKTTILSSDPAKAEPSKAEPAKVDAAKVEPVTSKIPDKYELKIPEGSEALYDKQLEDVASFSKERGLTNEQAQAVLERENKAAMSYQEAQRAALSAKSVQWVEELKSDKEFGGAAFSMNCELAKRALDRFADPELKKALNETGLGNHPLLVKAWQKVGKAMADDKFVNAGTTPSQPKSHEEILFPLEDFKPKEIEQ